MKKSKLYVVLFFIFLSASSKTSLWAQGKISWDFSDCEIRDIVYAVSVDSGISIITDDTVSGKTDFKFVGEDFETAFEAFVKSSRLFLEKNEEYWTVSRVKILSEDDKHTVFSYDCSPLNLIEKISGTLNSVITYESLPVQTLSVQLKNQTEEELIKNIVRCFPGYELQSTDTGYHIGKQASQRGEIRSAGLVKIEKQENDAWDFDLKNALFCDVMEEYFRKAGKPFCLLSASDTKITRAVFNSSSFTEGLETVCLQNGFECSLIDGVYYISANAKLRNGIISGKFSWVYFPLKFIQAEKMIQLVSKRFPKIETISLPGNEGFWANVSENEKSVLESFINQSDREQKSFFINLKNIKAEEFLSKLPPSVDKASVVAADGNCGLFFTGTEEAYEKLKKEIELCDRAPVRLRYDLLILQYEDSEENIWASNFSAKTLQKGDMNSASAQLGNVMSFNLNVIGAFGLDFAASLQASISRNKTKVFADTSLHGVAGKPISFSNTQTFRYRDNNVDPETGKPVYSGVTREIVSGLKLDVSGWVGDGGVITSTVTASVSRRGNDTSQVSGNPPPTTEKTVTTEVKGKSGEPVILSGLVQSSESKNNSRTPFISKIPLLGKFFKAESKDTEKTQMMIYLVPYIESETEICVNEKNPYNEEWAEKRKEGLCRITSSN